VGLEKIRELAKGGSRREILVAAVERAYPRIRDELEIVLGSAEDVAWREGPLLSAVFGVRHAYAPDGTLRGVTVVVHDAAVSVRARVDIVVTRGGSGETIRYPGRWSRSWARRGNDDRDARWGLLHDRHRCVICTEPALTERYDWASGTRRRTSRAYFCEACDRDHQREVAAVREAISMLHRTLGVVKHFEPARR
jgi:hypothetical protein